MLILLSKNAGVAQLVEQLIRNQQVRGSNPRASFSSRPCATSVSAAFTHAGPERAIWPGKHWVSTRSHVAEVALPRAGAALRNRLEAQKVSRCAPRGVAVRPRRCVTRRCEHERRPRSELLGQAGLLQHGIRQVARFDRRVYGEAALRVGAVPDFVIALAVALEAAAGGAQQPLERGRVVGHSGDGVRLLGAFRDDAEARGRGGGGGAGAVQLQQLGHHDAQLLRQCLEGVGAGGEPGHVIAGRHPDAGLGIPLGGHGVDWRRIRVRHSQQG